jgi:hypothetical protein
MKRILSCVIPLAAFVAPVFGQGLSLTIGSPVAGQDFALKTSQFIFRVNGCVELSKAQVTATAIDSTHRSVALHLSAPQPSGVFAVNREWGANGKWVVAITANCLRETVGAIVPINGNSFARDNIQLLSHAPSQDEIDAALKTFTPTPPLRQ